MGLDNPVHLAFIVVILLLVFGAKRLPEIGRSLGSGMREFKDSIGGESKHPPTLNASTQAQQPIAQPPIAQPAPTQEAPTPTAPQAPGEPQG